MQIWTYTLVSIVIVSLVGLAGIAAMVLGRKRLGQITTYLVSLAVGALLGGAFLHLIPAAQAELPDQTVWALVLSGFVVSFLLEKFLHAHVHGHSLHAPLSQPPVDERRAHPRKLNSAVGMIIVGDALHNLLDGVLIAASFIADPWVGLVTTIVVVVHEVPQEIGDFGVLLSGGLSVRRALLWNLASSVAAVAGAVATLIAGGWAGNVALYVLPLAAGNFIYIAAADLVPQLHDRRGTLVSVGQVAALIMGIFLMLGIHEWKHQFLEEHTGVDATGHDAGHQH